MTSPYTIAAIDAGSNAIRVQVSAVVAGELVHLESERVPVRLGANAFTVGELRPETIDDAVAAFARFRKLFDYHNVQAYRAVATSATRAVRNRVHLLHSIQYETGIDVEIIDGQEEMRLVREAVSVAMAGREKPALLLDLGGGSLEIGSDAAPTWDSVSLPIGTVRMMESFGLRGALGPSEVQMLARYIKSLFESFGVKRFEGSSKTAVVTGGNAEALCKLFGREDDGVWRLTRKKLKAALKLILPLDVAGRAAMWKLRQDRAEVIGIAGVIFYEALRYLGVEEMYAPSVGVREGVLLDLLAERVAERPSGSRAAALAGAFRAFMGRLGHEPSHGEQVRALALQLFDDLQPLHKLDADARLVLELAALVHDIGEVIDRRAHHHHSEYLVMHGRIPGLESPMREMVAVLSRAHRKSLPDASKHPVYASLRPSARSVIDRLVPLIRIADALDTDHRHQVRSVSVTRDETGYVMTVDVESLGDTTASVESLSRRNDGFEARYGVPIRTALLR